MFGEPYDFAAEERAERVMGQRFVDRLVEAVSALPVKNAETMAREAHRIVRETAPEWGHDPDIETFIKTPEESGRFMGGIPGIWIVSWEAGPYQWGVNASMALSFGLGKVVETHYGFDLQFYPGEDA